MNKEDLLLWKEYLEWYRDKQKPLREFNERLIKKEKERIDAFDNRVLEYDQLPWYKKIVTPNPFMEMNYRLPLPLIPTPTPTIEGFMDWKLANMEEES